MAKKKLIEVGKIFSLPTNEILNLKTNLDLVFEDGVVIENCYYKDIVLWRYLLDLINKFPIEITSDLWIEKYYTQNYFTGKTYLSLYSQFFKNFYTKKLDPDNDNTDILKHLFKSMYENMQMINRNLIREIIEYTTDIEIPDILEIQFNKELIDAIIKSITNKNQESVENTYKVLHKIFSNRTYNENPVTMLYLSGAVSQDQVKQLLGSRGYLTELDSKLFAEPMTNSFALGFKNMYEAAIESRAGAKAQFLSTKAIQDSEYANREIQLVTMVIERVAKEACEHPTYVDFYIRGPEYENNKKIYDGDLPNIIGKYYLDTDNVEKVITIEDKHLIGKTIKIRSGVYCSHKDKKAICHKCLGQLSAAILNDDNLGNVTATYVNGKRTQSLLSAKHLLKSASTTPLKLSNLVLNYFTLKKEKLYIKPAYLNKKTTNIFLRIKQNDAWGLKAASRSKNIRDIVLTKISKINKIDIVIVNTKTGEIVKEETLELKSTNRYAFLSQQFLTFVMEKGYETPDEENYLINIGSYHYKEPMFIYEKKEFDFAALNKAFKKLIKTRKFKKLKDGTYVSEYAPHVLVEQLFKLINTKLNINIALLEILVYALTIQDYNNEDFDLGRNAPIKMLGGFKEAINGRSIGASYDWDDLLGKVLNPLLYKEKYKPSTPMDVFFKPNEVIKNEGER